MLRNKNTPVTAPDDITVYEPVKKLGILAVQYVTPTNKIGNGDKSPVIPMYAKAGVIGKSTTSVLEIHLRDDINLNGVGHNAARRSLGLVAAYMKAHRDVMRPDEVLGVTDFHLGIVANTLGFHIHDVEPDKFDRGFAEKVYEASGRPAEIVNVNELQLRPDRAQLPNGRFAENGNVQSLIVAHLPAEEFIQQFGEHPEQ